MELDVHKPSYSQSTTMPKSKDEIMAIVLNDLLSIHNRGVEMTNRLHQNVDDSLAYFQELATQLSQPSSGPFVMKTPKILRKRAVPRIETIPENEVFEVENSQSTTSLQSIDMEEQETSILSGRSKRNASMKAANNIKKQVFQDVNTSVKKAKRQHSAKRKKSAVSSSDEDDIRSSSKYSKVDEDLGKPKRSKRLTKKKSEQVAQAASLKKIQETEEVDEENTVELSKLQCSDRSKLKSSQDGEVNKVDDMIVAPNTDNVEESLYEDAIEKPTPLMNSTMKHSSEKKLNVTVVLERLPKQTKLNETMVIQKVENNAESKKRSSTKKALQDSPVQSKKEIMEFNNYNELITEDESSPEVKRSKYNTKKEIKSLSPSDNEIPNTPMKTRLRGAPTIAQDKINKATYKSSALFNAYANESVKKRVEAFEQVAMNSPKSVDVDAPSRITRSKTRAMNTVAENVTQMLARKSLAKAKKISLAKQIKDTEEYKENKDTTKMPERITKLLDKPSTKQMQQKTTPLNKLRMVQPPTSINRQTPTNTQNILNCPKVLSAQRANILTGIDSLITKSVSKTNSTNSEKTEDKKRPEDDARKKRDETLRLLTEEKRRKRQQKELKNKLAREAKEKQELEKRYKAEKEREEKAKLAHLMQEKLREEVEKKRLALMQRAQEKEERRKLEEQQRLQKLQEQEEMERLLAEQRRREQEAEKRREAEVRAQQQAATEALKQKQLMLAAQAKNKPGPTDYKLESEPDDDSDDESRPKHEIPYWAQPHNRKIKLAMQRHIPQGLINKFFNTRKCTPDLTELFQGIDRSRLKRTSSAIWKMPPRTDMMEVESLSK
ncbi:inner centromere protein A-like isoform X2 [Linepithema humile]|uniref:inner centromere protein A-like isoform X2 n=1 Tax=Linepithema humile TaxID=83485 RepID=UPI0006238C8E|nr:PREDICTED: inner centromere protein A-like isoform X2 [Linepithema humile]